METFDKVTDLMTFDRYWFIFICYTCMVMTFFLSELKAIQAQKKGLRRPVTELKNGTHCFDETGNETARLVCIISIECGYRIVRKGQFCSLFNQVKRCQSYQIRRDKWRRMGWKSRKPCMRYPIKCCLGIPLVRSSEKEILLSFDDAQTSE